MQKVKLQSTLFSDTYYMKGGSGPYIFMVHGFAEDHSIWSQQAEHLGKHFTCILPDLPGTGMSLLSANSISIEDMARFIYEVALQEKTEKFIFLGHSMGGYIALAFAEKYPSMLAGFGLIHSTAYADDEQKKENRLKSIRLIEGNGKEVFLKAMVPNLYAEASRANKEQAISEHLTIALGISSTSLVEYYKAMIARAERTHVLKTAEVPVLFAIGKWDNAVPYTDMLHQSAMPNRSMVYFDSEIGHTGMLEAPEKLNSILNSYCEYVYNGNLP